MGIWQAFKAGANQIVNKGLAREFAENALYREAAEIGADAASAAAFHRGKQARMLDLMDDFSREMINQGQYAPKGIGESMAYRAGNLGGKAASVVGGVVSNPLAQTVAYTVLPTALYSIPQMMQGEPQMTEEEYNRQMQQQYAAQRYGY